MKNRKRLYASGIIFAGIFMLSVILGDGLLFAQSIGADEKAESVEVDQQNGEVLTEQEDIDSQPETEVQPENEAQPGSTVQPVLDMQPDSTTVADSSGQENEQENNVTEDTVTADPESSETAAPETADPEPVRIDFVIANVDSYLNIRQEPSTEAQILGKLYRGARATILERGEEWTYITSGTVTGYVANDYLMFDEEALLGAEEYGVIWVTVNADTLRIRKEPSTEAKVLDLAGKGTRLLGAVGVEETDGWVAIDYTDDQVGYVSAKYVTVTVELEEAISIEEEQRLLEEQRLAEERAAQAAREAEERAAAEAAAAEQEARAAEALQEAKKNTVGTTNRTAFDLSDEDAYLLAGVVHMESGNQSYEGKLAVANVVLNRLLSGKWGSTLESVIYAKGQFSGANTGVLQRFLDQGPNEGSLKAAAEAIAGVNNIGDYMAFCANRVAKYDTYKSYTIIDGHTFYKR